MTTRRPLVLNNGLVSELLDGDTVSAGTSTTEVIAGSGLAGGGSISSSPQLDVALAPNPSGIIYVGDALGLDGVAQVTANTALASGSAAAVLASNALASGNNSLVVGTAALASGNAALSLVPTLTGGGGPLQTTLVAGSAIASGYAVGVDDAGKAQSVSYSDVTGVTFPGSSVVFESADSQYIRSVYLPSQNSFIFAYSDFGNNMYGTAIAGNISGSTISFGTAVVFESVIVDSIDIDQADSAVCLIVYANRSVSPNLGRGVTATISGTSITPDTPVTFRTGSCEFISLAAKSFRFTISYRDNANSGYGTILRGRTLTNTFTTYSPTVFNSASTRHIANTPYGGNTLYVVSYSNEGNSQYGTSAVVSATSTTTTLQSTSVFASAASNYISSDVNTSATSLVIIYQSSGGKAVVGTVSGGTSISFGSPTTYSSVASYQSIIYDSINNLYLVGWRDLSDGRCAVGTVSGTSISFTTPVVFSAGNTWDVGVAYSYVSNRSVISYRNASNSNYGTALVTNSLVYPVYRPTVNSYPNVLGISQSTVTSGSPCLINLPGSLYNTPAADLTTGAFYYASPVTSGIVTNSSQPSSWNGQVPWNYIGRAVSTSGLMLLKSI